MYRKYPTFLVFPYICLFFVSSGFNTLGVSAKDSEIGAADKARETMAATHIDYAYTPRKKFFELQRFQLSGDLPKYKGHSKLIVKLSPAGTAELNPQDDLDPENEFEYKYLVVDLHDLSIESAEMLWGVGQGLKTKPECTLTFDLIKKASAPEHNVFHLDLKFVNDKLISYRLRGMGITKIEWIAIK